MSLVLACAILLAVDGDTIKCDGINMRDMGPGQPFKSGYDTPELGKAKCAEERAAGRKAKARMQQLLDQPGVRVVDSGKRDSYGRPLVWVRLPSGETAGDVLLREGYAVRWSPSYEPHWCPVQSSSAPQQSTVGNAHQLTLPHLNREIRLAQESMLG